MSASPQRQARASARPCLALWARGVAASNSSSEVFRLSSDNDTLDASEVLMTEGKSNSDDTQELLDRVRQGDRKAFDRLFAQYQAYLRRLIEMRMDSRLRA